MAAKFFYIGERINPQLSKSYFNAYGQLTKKEASKKQDCLYGCMILTAYPNKEEYDAAKDNIISQGFNLHNNE